jgi:putative oxidoreductase
MENDLRVAPTSTEERRVWPVNVNKGVLVLRLVVGLLFIGHGMQKLFGWFGGDGIAGFAASVGKAGIEPALLWAYMEAGAELTAGLLLVLGLLTPLAAALLIADMLVAILKVHASKGLWAQFGGFEYNLVLMALLVVIGLIGPGLYALDRYLSLPWPRPMPFVAALVVSLLVVGALILV